jgi:ABC-type sugar transport system substrate-binding protein
MDMRKLGGGSVGRRVGSSSKQSRPRWAAFVAVAAAVTAAFCVIMTTGGAALAHTSAQAAAGVKGYLGKVVPGYSGTDTKSMKLLLAPKLKKGAHFKVGYLQIDSSVHVINVEQLAASAEIKALGGTTVMLNANDNPNTQVQQLKQLLADGVNAIIAQPLIPEGVAQGFKQAAAQHIPVIVINQQTSAGVPHLPNTVTDVDQAMDYSTYETMKTITAKIRKGSSFAIMSLGIPVPVLGYQTQRDQYWGQKFGLKFVGTVPAAAATPEAYSAAAKALLTKYPTVKAIATLNDQAAVATASAAQTLGKSNIQIFTANGGDPVSVPDLKSGRVGVVYRVPWEQQGIQAAIAAYDAVTKQNQPLPPLINIPGTVVTKANVSKVPFAS